MFIASINLTLFKYFLLFFFLSLCYKNLKKRSLMNSTTSSEHENINSRMNFVGHTHDIGQIGRIECVVEFSNGNFALISCYYSEFYIRIYDKNTFECISKSATERVSRIFILNDGNLLCCGENIKILDKNTFVCLKTIDERTNQIKSLVQLNNGNFASFCIGDKKIKIHDANTFECIKNLNGHKGILSCMCVLSNGYLVSSSRDKDIKIWDMNKYECIQTLQNEYIIGNVFSLTALKNGTFISISSGRYTIDQVTIWDQHYESNNVYFNKLIRHEYKVECSTLLPCEKYLATGDYQGNILIWDLNTREYIQILHHSGGVKKLIALKNGLLISVNFNNKIFIWKKVHVEEDISRFEETKICCVNDKAEIPSCPNGTVEIPYCPICLINILNLKKMSLKTKVIKCGHFLCSLCIIKLNTNSCPVCRCGFDKSECYDLFL